MLMNGLIMVMNPIVDHNALVSCVKWTFIIIPIQPQNLTIIEIVCSLSGSLLNRKSVCQ